MNNFKNNTNGNDGLHAGTSKIGEQQNKSTSIRPETEDHRGTKSENPFHTQREAHNTYNC